MRRSVAAVLLLHKTHHTTPRTAAAVQILPMENVAGRDLVEAGNLCERKNGRGVDPNRNWDIDWGVKEKDYDPKEEYPGKAAFRCELRLGLRL